MCSITGLQGISIGNGFLNMTLSILIRSILISFLVAVPAPFVIEWLSKSVEVNNNISVFFAIYVLAFVGCVVMGLSGQRSAPSTQPESSKDERELGTVKWFNVAKGFGFITRSTGEDVFVHYRSIRGSGRRALSEGQQVKFTVSEGEKGLQADDVSAVR